LHDIRMIREDPGGFDAALAHRYPEPMAQTLLKLDQDRRLAIHSMETLVARKNRLSKQAGQAKRAGDEEQFQVIRQAVESLNKEIEEQRELARSTESTLNEILLGLPNLPLDDVPDGPDETANVEIHRWGNPRNFDFEPREHFDIPAARAGLDFEAAARLSGTRFVVMRGAMIRLHRALAQFMLDTHTEKNGLTEVWTPVLVRDEAMLGTGQLPKFKEDSFFGASMTGRDKLFAAAVDEGFRPTDAERIRDRDSLKQVVRDILERATTREEFWLIPTSEVTLTNLVAGQILDAAELPIRMTAHTQCFRSEAGSAGKDTAGMLRQHQFEKVEMVSITTPETSLAELERMTRCAQGILEALGLPYRTVVLSTGDMGFAARRTHDVEVWLPGQGRYREISSCSVCGDFQARRMNARFRRGAEAKPEFVHTLNGSGLAVGRTLIAVLENCQQADGSVALPEALHPWLGGRARVEPDGRLA
jgi:seryl-tRNA synthetase